MYHYQRGQGHISLLDRRVTCTIIRGEEGACTTIRGEEGACTIIRGEERASCDQQLRSFTQDLRYPGSFAQDSGARKT